MENNRAIYSKTNRIKKRLCITAVWQNGGFSAKTKFSSSIELLCKTELLCFYFRHFAKLQTVTTHLRITVEHIRENYLILIIKISIICLFIFSLIYGISNIIDHYFAVGDWNADKLTEYFNIATNNYYLRPSLILLIPILGIFTNKSIGWILIQSYFYYLITNLAFPATQIDFTDITLIIINIIGFLLILLIIILMNKKKISNLVYGIKKSELINKNIIASVIGISITIILVMIKGNGI